MILSNLAIVEALDAGRLVIDPRPDAAPAGHPTRFNTTSVDLTLSDSLLLPRRGLATIIDPRRGDMIETLVRMGDSFTIDPEQGYRLDPEKFILGRTRERIALPLPEIGEVAGLAARVEGKSSLARLGLLVHFTAPTIHAGFEGTITLEIMNLGPAPILLTPGLSICQLIVEEVSGPLIAQPGRYQGQQNPAG